jgi:hypothetical protein
VLAGRRRRRQARPGGRRHRAAAAPGRRRHEQTGRERYAAWQKKPREFFQQPQPESEDGQQKWQQAYEALDKEREAFATEESTGFVWLLRGK